MRPVDRLVEAINSHDLERMVACFAPDYRNETPVHPLRGFEGNGQVRTNWSQIFASVPDIHATVIRSSTDGDSVWTEWDITGNRTDGAPFAMAGCVIFGLRDDAIASARFYLEPVEAETGDVNAHTRRVTGTEGRE